MRAEARPAHLDDGLRRRLIEALVAVPRLSLAEPRDQLLAQLPDLDRRSRTSAEADLTFIIEALEELPADSDGGRPLVRLLDNAIEIARPGTRAATDLERLRPRVEAIYGAAPPSASIPSNQTLEALPFQGIDARLSFAFMERGAAAARSVCRLTVPRTVGGVANPRGEYGTGWLMTPELILTCHHVVDARDVPREPHATPGDLAAQVAGTELWFDYFSERGQHATYREGLALVASSPIDGGRKLDYALLRVTKAERLAGRHPLTIARPRPPLSPSARVNIVQHGGGGPLRYAIRNNFVVDWSASLLWYLTETEPGSSGSPVLDDKWQVVALHHSAKSVTPRSTSTLDQTGPAAARFHNEGIDLQAILADLSPPLREEIARAQGWG